MIRYDKYDENSDQQIKKAVSLIFATGNRREGLSAAFRAAPKAAALHPAVAARGKVRAATLGLQSESSISIIATQCDLSILNISKNTSRRS